MYIHDQSADICWCLKINIVSSVCLNGDFRIPIMKEYGTIEDLLSAVLPFKVKYVLNLKSEGTIASTRQNVTVVTEDGDEILIFMKVRRKGSVTEEFDQVYKMFHRESVMYGEVLPLLNHFLHENVPDNKLKVLDMFPKYYG